MKTALIILIAISALTNIALSQPPGPPDTLWTETYGGASSDYSYEAQQTSDGGYIIVGSSSSFSTNYNVHLIKTNHFGVQQWYGSYGGTSTDWGYSVQQTDDGGYIISGQTDSYGVDDCIYLTKTDTWGNQRWFRVFAGGTYGVGQSVRQTTDRGYVIAGTFSGAQVHIIKTDSLGNQQWTQTLGGNGDDDAYDIRQTDDGGYIIVGHTSSYGAGNFDVYLLKTDAQGILQWERTFGGGLPDYGRSVQLTSDGGYIIAGYTYSFGAGLSDVYLIKTDSLGFQQWSNTYGGFNIDEGHSVYNTADGGYVIAGHSKSFSANNYYNVYVIKTDSLGSQQWDVNYGGNFDDYGYYVQQVVDGGYVIAGYTNSFGLGFNDVYVIRLRSEIPAQLSIALVPVNPPLVIPPTGGNFQFTITIDNLGLGVAVIDTWFNILAPGMIIPKIILNCPDISLPVGGNQTRTITQFVPATSPTGTYIISGLSGEFPTYIADWDSFTFVKSP